jgi:hypothetical protein
VTAAEDSCSSANESALPVEDEAYALREVCAGADEVSSGGVDRGAVGRRRSFQFLPTDAWSDFCAGAQSVRCADVLADTGGDVCEAEFICNYRYDSLDQIMDFCAWYLVCSCDAQGCTTNPEPAWRYTIEPTTNADELYVKIRLVDASTGSIHFESVGFRLYRRD